MVQFNRIQFTVFVTALLTISLSAAPIQATIRQQSHQKLTEIKDSYLALSWGDIWNIISRKKKPGGSRGWKIKICAIAPAKLVDKDAKPKITQEIQEVWSEHPLFLWNIQGGTAQRIELSFEGNENAFWSRYLDGKTGIVYDGEPLKPGQSYEWRLAVPYPIMQSMFRVMESEERNRITADLKQIEEQFKGASAEKISLEKANYFANKELWSDALLELYSVPNPSAELTQAIKQIQDYDFCTGKPKNSAS